MQNNLSSTKNLIWAIAVIVCLVASLVGLIYSLTGNYPYEREIPVVELGAAGSEKSSGSDSEEDRDKPVLGQLNELKKLKGDSDYIRNVTFLCASNYSRIGAAGADISKVWLGEDGKLAAGAIDAAKIIFPGDNSSVTAVNAAMISKPDILVVMPGTDSLAATDEDTFKTSCASLIKLMNSSSPNTQIIFCSIPSFAPTYNSQDGLMSVTVDNANLWLQQVCSENEVWYADTASLICSEGYLKGEFDSGNGITINEAGCGEILSYLQNHALP